MTANGCQWLPMAANGYLSCPAALKSLSGLVLELRPFSCQVIEASVTAAAHRP